MQGDINRFSTIERDGWQILIEEGFKHDNFITML